MKRPQVGDHFSAYFTTTYYDTARVVEWKGRRCFFDNGYFLIWGGESHGFYL